MHSAAQRVAALASPKRVVVGRCIAVALAVECRPAAEEPVAVHTAAVAPEEAHMLAVALVGAAEQRTEVAVEQVAVVVAHRPVAAALGGRHIAVVVAVPAAAHIAARRRLGELVPAVWVLAVSVAVLLARAV